MDRRNFLKTGGIALLGSLATGSAMALTTPGVHWAAKELTRKQQLLWL